MTDNKRRNTGHLRLVKHITTAEGSGLLLLEDTPDFTTVRDAERYIKDKIVVGDNVSLVRVVKTYKATEKVSKVVTGVPTEGQLELWD